MSCIGPRVFIAMSAGRFLSAAVQAVQDCPYLGCLIVVDHTNLEKEKENQDVYSFSSPAFFLSERKWLNHFWT